MEKCCLRIRRPGKAKLCKKWLLSYMLLVVILLGETVPLLETVFVDPECLSRIQDLLKIKNLKFKNLEYPPPVQHKSPARRWP